MGAPVLLLSLGTIATASRVIRSMLRALRPAPEGGEAERELPLSG